MRRRARNGLVSFCQQRRNTHEDGNTVDISEQVQLTDMFVIAIGPSGVQ